MSVLRFLPEQLCKEDGGSFGFVCIWRRGQKDSDDRTCSVGEFLSDPENFGGSWFIDGGWGGPPGPIRVDWDERQSAWINRGFPPHREKT